MYRNAKSRGELQEEYRFFHLKDRSTGNMDYHYHEFNKVVIFISGEASYIIEGRTYKLQPWDVVFVRHHTIHKPEVNLSCEYNRIVLWLDNAFLLKYSTSEFNLSECFEFAENSKSNVLRTDAHTRLKISKLCQTLETEQLRTDGGSEIAAMCNLINLMVTLNRNFGPKSGEKNIVGYKTDPKIESVMSYINNHHSEDLSVDKLSALCFMSRYHFMRRFKEISGYTVHN